MLSASLNKTFPSFLYHMSWHHITVNKNVLSASLNKTFPSFLYHMSWHHITVNKNVLSALLNKTFPSFRFRYVVSFISPRDPLRLTEANHSHTVYMNEVWLSWLPIANSNRGLYWSIKFSRNTYLCMKEGRKEGRMHSSSSVTWCG